MTKKSSTTLVGFFLVNPTVADVHRMSYFHNLNCMSPRKDVYYIMHTYTSYYL